MTKELQDKITASLKELLKSYGLAPGKTKRARLLENAFLMGAEAALNGEGGLSPYIIMLAMSGRSIVDA